MTQPTRRIMRRFRLDEISMVDQPAQEPARMTLLKRKEKVTKAVGGKNFFAKDFAYVEDETDPTTWKYRLTDKPNGKPTPARVNAAIKQFGAQRYQIPPDALDSILDKLREAWIKAFPSKDPNADMPSELSGAENKQVPPNGEADPANGAPPPNGEEKAEGEEDEEAAAAEGETGDEPPTEGDEDNGDFPPANEDEEDEEEKKKTAPAKKAKTLAAQIVKAYIDPSEGSMTFSEVLQRCEEQDRMYEMMDKAWPLLSAMDTSIRSIIADKNIDTAAKHTMLRSSVESFLAAMKEAMPEIEEVLEKALTSLTSRGDDDMANGGSDLTDLKKRLDKLEKERDEAMAKAKTLEQVAALTSEEKEYYDKADDKAKAEFLTLEKSARAAVVKKFFAEDETIVIDGQSFSKSSTDPLMWAFVKSQAAKIADFEKKLADEKAAREEAEIAKKAQSEFANLALKDDEKLALLKSVYALPEAERDNMLKVLKASNSTAALALKRLGTSAVNGGNAEVNKSADAGFEKAVAEIRKRDNCSRVEAIRKARKENPEQFASWNGGTAH